MIAPAPLHNSLYERIGDISLPVNSDSIVAADLVLPDALKDTLLGLFAAAINYELAGSVTAGTCATGTAWSTIRTGTELAAFAAIQDTFPGLPTEQLRLERKAAYPCLYLDRVGQADTEEFTLSQEKRTQQWELTWVLGPMTAGNAQKYRAACTAYVPTIVARTIRRGGHPAYQSGQTLLGGGTDDTYAASLWSIRFLNSVADAVPFGEGSPIFYGCTMRLETVELDASVDGAFSDFTGATLKIDGGGGDHGLIPELVVVDSDHPG